MRGWLVPLAMSVHTLTGCAMHAEDRAPPIPESMTVKWLKSCVDDGSPELFGVRFARDGTVEFDGGATTRESGRVTSTIGEQPARAIFDAADQLSNGSRHPATRSSDRSTPRFCLEIVRQVAGRTIVKRRSSSNAGTKEFLEAVRSTVGVDRWVCPPRMIDQEINGSLLSWGHCTGAEQEKIVQLNLHPAASCGGGEVAAVYRDGTVHHYRYRRGSRGFEYLLEEFLQLSPTASAGLPGFLRTLRLEERDQPVGESMTRITAAPAAYFGDVPEAAEMRDWLGQQVPISFLPAQSNIGVCQPGDPSSNLQVLKSYLSH